VNLKQYDEPVKPYRVTLPSGRSFTVWAEGYAEACVGVVEHLAIEVEEIEE
jgi:hypothetical protein